MKYCFQIHFIGYHAPLSLFHYLTIKSQIDEKDKWCRIFFQLFIAHFWVVAKITFSFFVCIVAVSLYWVSVFNYIVIFSLSSLVFCCCSSLGERRTFLCYSFFNINWTIPEQCWMLLFCQRNWFLDVVFYDRIGI